MDIGACAEVVCDGKAMLCSLVEGWFRGGAGSQIRQAFIRFRPRPLNSVRTHPRTKTVKRIHSHYSEDPFTTQFAHRMLDKRVLPATLQTGTMWLEAMLEIGCNTQGPSKDASRPSLATSLSVGPSVLCAGAVWGVDPLAVAYFLGEQARVLG